MSRERELFDRLYEPYQQGNQDDWLKVLNSSKVYPIQPVSVNSSADNETEEHCGEGTA